MSLGLLPDEIILDILSHIDIISSDKRAFASLCLSSRRLNALTTPLLYYNFTDNWEEQPNNDDEINKRNLRTFPLFLRTLLSNPSLGSHIVHIAIKPYFKMGRVYMTHTMDVMNDADWNRVASHVTAIKTLYPYKPNGGDWIEGVCTGRWCAVLALTLCFLTSLEKLHIRGLGITGINNNNDDVDFLAAFMEMVSQTQRGEVCADLDSAPLHDDRNFPRASMEMGSRTQIGKTDVDVNPTQIGKTDVDVNPTPLHNNRKCLGAFMQMISRTKKRKTGTDPKPARVHLIQGSLLPKYSEVDISCAAGETLDWSEAVVFSLPPSVKSVSATPMFGWHWLDRCKGDLYRQLTLKRICLRDGTSHARYVESLLECCPQLEDLIVSHRREHGSCKPINPALYMPGLQRVARTLVLLDLDHNPIDQNYDVDMRLGPFKDFEALTHLSLWWGFLLGLRGEGLNASMLRENLPKSLESLHVHGTDINAAAISSLVRQCGELVLNKEELAPALKKVSLSVRYPHGLENICYELNSGRVAQLENLCQSKGVRFSVDSSTCLDQNHIYCHNYDLRAALFCKVRDAPVYYT